MTRITVEVEEGSRAWALAMHTKGVKVQGQDAHGVWSEADPYDYSTSYWRLLVRPPPPITVQPGTFAWAMAMLAAGKRVASGAADCTLLRYHGDIDWLAFGDVHYETTDWEVVS